MAFSCRNTSHGEVVFRVKLVETLSMSVRITGYSMKPGTRQQPAIISRLNRPILTFGDPQPISIGLSLTNNYGVKQVGAWANFERVNGATTYWTNGVPILEGPNQTNYTYTHNFYGGPGEVVLRNLEVREFTPSGWGRVLETVSINRSYIIQTFTPRIVYEKKGETLSGKSLSIIQEAMLRIGEKDVKVTSMRRTPADQSRIMFEAIITHKSIEGGISYSRKLYDKPGEKVINYFKQKMTKNATKDPLTGITTITYFSKEELLTKKDTIISGGVELINKLGPSNVSKHCLSDAEAKKLQVFDIAPSSLISPDANNQINFNSIFTNPSTRDAAVKGFLSPFTSTKDKSFHFEIAQ